VTELPLEAGRALEFRAFQGCFAVACVTFCFRGHQRVSQSRRQGRGEVCDQQALVGQWPVPDTGELSVVQAGPPFRTPHRCHR
jgi:hypothetical protein